MHAEINGVRLHYEIVGHGAPVVLLHGGGMSSSSLRHQKFQLATSFRVIAIDSRGHGKSSDGDSPLSYALMASDVEALLTQLGVERASVVGWSDGGVVGLHLAIHRRERLDRLVMIGANYRVDGLSEEWLAWARTVTAESWTREFIPASRRRLEPGVVVGSRSLEFADSYRRESPHPERWPILVEKLKAMWTREPSFAEDELAGIRSPSLVVVGDRDIVQHEHTLELFRAIPDAELCVLPGASHFVPWEKPMLVSEVLRGFLARPTP